jgi:hypothetical protein
MNQLLKRWTTALALVVLPVAVLGMRLGLAAADDKAKADKPVNQLTDAEKKAGWKLLFDGKTLDGWHNFKKDTVNPGWEVKDGTLACTDPKKAGDIVTADKFDWFELSIEYNISEAGNSGIMFHITNDGNAMWESGPEVQLLDNVKGADKIRSGWLYQLYQPPDDPKTKKPLDATKPVGEWNLMRIVIAPPPAKSSVEINGVKYYDFVWNSDDFKARVAKSKFADMKYFAKSDTGFLGLQGDHGAVAFRNIKLRPIKGGERIPSDQ